MDLPLQWGLIQTPSMAVCSQTSKKNPAGVDERPSSPPF